MPAHPRRTAAAHRTRPRPRRPAAARGARAARGRRSRPPSHARARAAATPASKNREQQLDGLDPDPRVPLGESIRAQEHRRADDLVRIRLADTAGMAPQQPKLELARLLGRDLLGDEPPEARVDAVRVVAELPLDQRSRGPHPLASAIRQLHPATFDGDLPHLVNAKVVAGETEASHRGASLMVSPTRSRPRPTICLG